ncbi:MAG TPA: hypothetical protein VFO41_02170 [Alphaproteobacteria bacterium]|nr:hypothetical protein [Alphaproteobacteria bacterium]
MQITERDLVRAAETGILSRSQAQSLWRFLEAEIGSGESSKPRFDAIHILWYGGALIVIGAMTLFTTEAWQAFGGRVLALIGAVYGVAAWALGHHFWRRDLRVPGGLLITVAVAMVPLTVYGLQNAMGWWTGGTYGDFPFDGFVGWARGSFAPMEAATILAGALALARYRFGFITMPMAVAGWMLAIDLTPWILDLDEYDWEARHGVSAWFGMGMMAFAWAVDLKGRQDFAFWLHLFGIVAFWSGLTLLDSGGELARAAYCLINMGLIGLSLFLSRRVYAVFGALGVALYLGHLAGEVFGDSLLFPFALSLVGLAVIVGGVILYRRRARLDAWLDRILPAAVRALRPDHARPG